MPLAATMTPAVSGGTASSSANNAIITNVLDHEARVTALEASGAPPGAPFFHGYQNAGTTVPLVTATALPFQVELSDTHNWHAANSAFYIPQLAGRYQCFGTVYFAPAASGGITAQFRKNSAVYAGAPYSFETAVNQGFAANAVSTYATIVCNGTTDTISLWANHNLGMGMNTYVDANVASFMAIRYLGA